MNLWIEQLISSDHFSDYKIRNCRYLAPTNGGGEGLRHLDNTLRTGDAVKGLGGLGHVRSTVDP
jgi:hypothetical protein